MVPITGLFMRCHYFIRCKHFTKNRLHLQVNVNRYVEAVFGYATLFLNLQYASPQNAKQRSIGQGNPGMVIQTA